uniref:Uncharacterized protein n=1 Tax=Setaria viridis TaxID=4556 RepID=A0A4V6DBK9_SETVI|nr:hypothetical protein SEVIR_2G310851v2 [Setaria viridis]
MGGWGGRPGATGRGGRVRLCGRSQMGALVRKSEK